MAGCQAWKPHAETIEMARPNQDGVYEFELTLAYRMSMTVEEPEGHFSLVDYYSLDQKNPFWKRISDQDQPCHAAFPMNLTDEDAGIQLESMFQLNGRHERIITINGKSPGPSIIVPLGAEVLMRVINEVGAVTIHVHGMDKKNLWYTDGVAFIQQCPIAPGSIYTYRFIADTPGTHWYHGHLGTDRGFGLLGAFIVLDINKKTWNIFEHQQKLLEPTRDYIFMMQDWPKMPAEDVWYGQRWKTMKWMYGYDGYTKCWAPTRTFDGSNIGGAAPNAGLLVNGKGWQWQEEILNQPWALPLERFSINYGETIRFRLINGAMSHPLMISLEEHRILLVSADGIKIKPLEVDHVILYPGERYDILVQGKAKSLSSKLCYYFLVETLEHYARDWKVMEPSRGMAMLIYNENDGAGEHDRPIEQRSPDYKHSTCTLSTKCLVANCPFENFPSNFPFDCINAGAMENAETIENTEILSNTGFKANFEEFFINMHYDSHVNGWMFKFPRGMPYFHPDNENRLAKWCDPLLCKTDLDLRFDENCYCFYHLNITLNSIVQLTVYNMGIGAANGTGFAHPLHIHGTHFYLMKMGFPEYDSISHTIQAPNRDINCSGDEHCNDRQWSNSEWLNGRIPSMNQLNPTFRDTVVVPLGGYVTIRFHATNPGWFFAHCHVSLHMMGGTAFALRIGDHDQMPKPPDEFPKQCGIFESPPLPRSLTTSNGNWVSGSIGWVFTALLMLKTRIFMA